MTTKNNYSTGESKNIIKTTYSYFDNRQFLSTNLKNARIIKTKLTAKAVAGILGISRTQLSRYEHGQVTPDAILCNTLCKFYKIDSSLYYDMFTRVIDFKNK